MALMTSCPACHTFFRVVPDQLRLHLGLVRCGSCEHVFDANQRLESITELPATQLAPDIQNDQSWTNKPAVKVFAKNSKVTAAPAPSNGKSIALSADHNDIDERSTKENTAEQSAQSVAEQEALKRRRARKKAYLKKQALLAQQSAEPAAADSLESVLTEVGDADSGGGRGDNRPSKLSAVKAQLHLDGALGRGFKRYLAAILIAFLTVLGGMQLVLAARYPIADTVPMAKPLLVWLCDSARCELEPALWLQPLSLDALSLTKRTDAVAGGGLQTYRMIATVRNSSALAVIRPDIELSINNLQGALLARKVLPSQALASPKDRAGSDGLGGMQANNTVILPNGDWQIDVDVFLDAQTLGYTGRLVHSPQQ